jgi:predicted glycoside hydrolase/deacetylase ChbG (UPF0249 family)
VREEVLIAMCVDDLGLHEGVLQAAMQLQGEGLVSAASALVDGPCWVEAAAWLRDCDPARMEAGLHFNLTEPLGAVPDQSLLRLIARAQMRLLDLVALQAEFERQLDRFERDVGREPEFVDGHRHVHQLPGVREVIVHVLGTRYARKAGRPWLRRCAMPSGATRHRDAGRMKARVVQAMGAHALHTLASVWGFEQNRCLLGARRFADASFAAAFEDWIASARTGDLLVCHPSAATLRPDALIVARIEEFHFLREQAVQILLRHGVRVVPMRAIFARGSAMATGAPA